MSFRSEIFKNKINLFSIAILLLSFSMISTKLSEETYEIEIEVPDELDNEIARFGDIIEIEGIDEEFSELYLKILLRRNIILIKNSECQAEVFDSFEVNSDLRKNTNSIIKKLGNVGIHEENHEKYFIRARTLGKDNY